MYTYITDLLCCTPETNAMMQINYTPIIKKKNRFQKKNYEFNIGYIDLGCPC